MDGEIVYGESLVSMQHITGESLPLRRGPGAQVPAGSQNHDGVLVLKVTQAVSDSTPARISRLARQAQVTIRITSMCYLPLAARPKRPQTCVGGLAIDPQWQSGNFVSYQSFTCARHLMSAVRTTGVHSSCDVVCTWPPRVS